MANLVRNSFGHAVKLHIAQAIGCRSFAFRQSRLCSSGLPKPPMSKTSDTAEKVARICSQAPCPPPPPSNKSKTFVLLTIIGLAGGAGVAYYLNATKESEIAEPPKPSRRKKVPESSALIPKEVPYLLIGGGTASFSAFRAIKSNDPTAKVMVITAEKEMPYMRPPLSKELWFTNDSSIDAPEKLQFKQWNGHERSLFYEPDDFYADPTKLLEEPNGGVAIVRGYTVKHIDVCNRIAVLTDGTEIKYKECLLATGSSPKNLDIFNAAPLKIKEKISFFRTTQDFEKLRSIANQSSSIAIVGGGFLGSELSCALAKYGEKNQLQVYQVFHENGNMGKILPEYLSVWTADRVREEGVNVIPKAQIESVEWFGKNQVKLNLNTGKSLVVDHVLVAVGSEPNVDLATESGLEVDSKLGGYVVNAELEARRHLYVAGDAACFYDPKLGRRRVEHHDHAVVSGRLAGENMVGLKKPYKHQSMFWSDLGPKIGYEAIGIVDASLPTVGVFAKASPNDSPATSGTDHLDKNTKTEQNQHIPSIASTGNSLLESKVAKSQETSSEAPCDDEENYGKGVIFYLRNDIIVGIVLWNVFNRINIARVIVSEGKRYDDLNEVAKLFEIHS